MARGDIEQGVHITGMAAVVDGQQHASLRGDAPLDVGGVDIESVLFDIAEHRVATRHQDRVIAGDESQRSGQHLAALDAAGDHGQVQRRRAGVEGDGVFDADVLGEALFESARLFAITDPARFQGCAQGFVFGRFEPGFENLNGIRQ